LIAPANEMSDTSLSMKTIAFLLLATGACRSFVLHAQTSDPPTGRVSPAEIVEKYLAATGGLEAHKKLSRITASGDFGFFLQHPLGTYNFYYKAPASDMLQVQMTSHGNSWTGHYEGKAVRGATVEGVGMINGAGMQVVEQAWLSLLESEFKHYSRIELVGLSKVAHQWAYALRFTPLSGDPQVRYFDCQSFFLVRLDQVQRFQLNKNDPQLAYSVESYFYEYHDVAGVKLPRRIAVSRDEGELTFDIPAIKTDVDIADTVFTEHIPIPRR
jgi:hypothetical protein